MRELALFAGAGGGILGGHLLGWRTVCAVEWDAYAASVLVQRQNDGCLPPFPIWDDVQTFDGRPWRGRVDVISGGFPCTDISCAGRGAGIEGKESGMWGHMARIINEVRPREGVFIENSPMLAVGRGLGTVLCDLAEMGYDARWGVVGAHHVAAPHKRDRIWIVADSHSSGGEQNSIPSELRTEGAFQSSGHSGETAQTEGEQEPQGRERFSDPDSKRSSRGLQDKRLDKEGREVEGRSIAECSSRRERGRDLLWWPAESDLGGGLPDEMASRVDINGTTPQEGISRVGKNIPHRIGRLTCIGNGQVPQCAALAWKILCQDEQ